MVRLPSDMTSTVTEHSLRTRAGLRRGLPPPAQRRALRQAAGLTLDDLAHLVGCTPQAVDHWEAGRREPSGQFLAAYVDALRLARELA